MFFFFKIYKFHCTAIANICSTNSIVAFVYQSNLALKITLYLNISCLFVFIIRQINIFFATFSYCLTAPLGTPQLRRALISFCPVDNFIIIHYAQITYKYTNYLMTWIKRTLFPYFIHYKFKYFNLSIKNMCFILVFSKLNHK